MRIIRFEASNIKRLHAVAIEPSGSIVQITGENGSGKSSVLDSIMYALFGGKLHPAEPIRQGEQKAHVFLDLGDGNEVKFTVKRRFSAGGTSLVVESPDGAQFKSPQAMLERMLGALTFDPLEFARLDPKKRLEMLRSAVHVEEDIDALDRDIAGAYARRTEWNKVGKSANERAAIYFAQWQPAFDVPDEDLSELSERLRTSNEALRRHLAERTRREDELRHAGDLRRDAREMRVEAEHLLEQAAALEDQASSVERELVGLEPLSEVPTTASLLDELEAKQATNRLRDVHRTLGRQVEQARLEEKNAIDAANDLTAQIERATLRKRVAIENAPMPVPGMTFGDGEVLFNGVPFAQASTAEQIRVSTALAIALNPTLRVISIRDGSLLSEKSLAQIAAMAEQHDMQVWIERVATGEPIGFEMVDGAVASIDGVPVDGAGLTEVVEEVGGAEGR